jgi:hypothetical protein
LYYLLIKIFFNVIKMKRKLNILFALLVAGIYCAQAQVIIGADRVPHVGAMLELESNGNHGLLLPKVILANYAGWELTSNPLVDKVEGMLVFNPTGIFTDGLNGKGIYIWLNDKWRLAQGVFNMPLTLGAIMVSGPANNIYTASVAAIPGALSYEWLIPAGVLGFSNTNEIQLVKAATGTATYTIGVRAVNSSGAGSPQTISVSITR